MSDIKRVIPDSSSSSDDSDDETITNKKCQLKIQTKGLKGHGGTVVKQGFMMKRVRMLKVIMLENVPCVPEKKRAQRTVLDTENLVILNVPKKSILKQMWQR